MQDIKNLSYQSKSLEFKVIINGVDYADDVTAMSPITQRLDNQELNKYRVGNTTITLKDPEGLFSPEGETQWVGEDVTIQAGFDNTLKDLFKGKIFRTSHNSPASTSEIFVNDTMQDIFRTEITDFGVDKNYGIRAGRRSSINGFYPVLDSFFPASKDSVEVNKSVSDSLTEVDKVSRKGPLNPNHFEVSTDGIITEGGEITDAAEGYPQIKYKAPLRYKDVSNIIESLLSSTGITNHNIDIPDIPSDANLSSNGRIGYDVVGTAQFGTSKTIDWQGYITDVIYDTTNSDYYYLYNPVRGDRANTAFILRKNKDTGEEKVIHRAAQNKDYTTEYWKLAKRGNNIAVLATDADRIPLKENNLPDISVPKTGSYDATETGNNAYIFLLDTKTGNTSERVAKSSSVKPQLAHRYIFGQTYGDYRSLNLLSAQIPQRPPYILPDTRKSFLFHENDLYFVAVTATHVGVAKVGLTTPVSFITGIPFDNQGNQCGCDFDIVNDSLLISINFKEANRSRVVSYQTSL